MACVRILIIDWQLGRNPAHLLGSLYLPCLNTETGSGESRTSKGIKGTHKRHSGSNLDVVGTNIFFVTIVSTPITAQANLGLMFAQSANALTSSTRGKANSGAKAMPSDALNR